MNSVYTSAESRADAVVHFAGVTVALVGVSWLVGRLFDRPHADAMALGFYGIALIGMLGVSAAYNLATSPLKHRLRRSDHAMIFVMITATYTPFVSLRLPAEVGTPLAVVVWSGCMSGVLIKLLFPRRFGGLSVVLYWT